MEKNWPIVFSDALGPEIVRYKTKQLAEKFSNNCFSLHSHFKKNNFLKSDIFEANVLSIDHHS